MRTLGVAALCVFTLLPWSLAAQPLRQFVFSRPLMGTQFWIHVLSSDSLRAEAGADSAFARVDLLNRHLSDYFSDSELTRLSRSSGSGRTFPVSEDLWLVLSKAQRIAQDTGGRFDPTVGPLTRLWRWAFRRNMLPGRADIEWARTRVGYHLVELEDADRSVRLRKRGMRLDLGGIAKGFAADEALRVLASWALPFAVVDAGGDIALGASPPDSAGWPVTLDTLGEVHLAGCGIATSGATHRHMVYDGVRYSHILDPRTGIGLTHHRTIAVVAPTAMEADALASAASVMTAKELEHFGYRTGARVCEVNAQEPVVDLDYCVSACRASIVGIIAW